MHLSIVIPVLNEARRLPVLVQHLNDLRQQAEGSVDVILVDGGSNDETVAWLKASGVPWIKGPRGRASQMNAGAAATRGEALLFLHADTQIPSGGLRSIRRAIEAGHVGGFFRVDLDSKRRLLRLVGLAISMRSRLTGIATGDQAIFVRRSAFDAIGGYAPLRLFEDVDLTQRLRRLGSLACLSQTVTTSARRWEQHGPWRVIFRMWLLRLLYAAGISPARLARYYGIAR